MNFSKAGGRKYEVNIEKNKNKPMIKWSIFFRRLPSFPIIACLYLQHIYIILTTIIRTFYTRPFVHYSWDLNTAISQTPIHKVMKDLKYLTLMWFRKIINKSSTVVEPSQGPILAQQWRTDIGTWSKRLSLDRSQGKDASKISLLKTNFRSNKNSYWTM